MTRKDILDNWPPDFTAPSSITLYRWLEEGLKRGLIKHDGLGTKSYPFRYWLAERDNDPWHAYWTQEERYYQELHRIMLEMNCHEESELPPAEREKARTLARQRAYGDTPVKAPWEDEKADAACAAPEEKAAAPSPANAPERGDLSPPPIPSTDVSAESESRASDGPAPVVQAAPAPQRAEPAPAPPPPAPKPPAEVGMGIWAPR